MVKVILAPLDGAVLAERALPYAVRLPSAAGARLILMHGRAPLATLGEQHRRALKGGFLDDSSIWRER